MPYYPEDSSPDNLKKLIRQNVCSVCGRQLYAYLDEDRKTYIACPTPGHEGITKEYQPTRWAEAGLDSLTHDVKEETMVQELGEATSKALVAKGLPLSGQLTRPQAREIVMTIWDKAPEIEVYKATALCADFGLHPLMRHIYLIKYNRYEGTGNQRHVVGEDWVIQLGIGATRLIAHRQHRFGYKDDTPRRMTKEEGAKILGDDYKPDKNTYGITRLIDMDTKAEVTGVGSFGNSEPDPKGMNKGNTRLNMACIRSERKAIDRQYPAEMPTGYEVYDERYAGTPSDKEEPTPGEVTKEPLPDGVEEGVFREATPSDTPEPPGVVGEEPEKAPTSTTEVPPGVEEEQVPELWPEDQPHTTTPAPESQVAQGAGGYLDENATILFWIKETLPKVKWTEKTACTWLTSKFAVKGGLLEEVLGRLTKEQIQIFTKEIQDRLEMA